MTTPLQLGTVYLEKLCPACDGRPPEAVTLWQLLWGDRCQTCNNKGVILTPAGEALCQFIQRHMDTTEGRLVIR